MDEKNAKEFKDVIGIYHTEYSLNGGYNKSFVPQGSHIQFTMVKYKSKGDIYKIYHGPFILFKGYDKDKVENELNKWCKEHGWFADIKYKVRGDDDEEF